MKASSHRLAGLVGNILEHYDNALFGLLAPFLAPLFFPDKTHLTALIMTYGMLPIGCLTRPLGSLFFGWIGDTYGRRHALSLSLTGMAFTCVAMGFLPVHGDVGAIAPLLLALLRMLQSFFMAGESVGGAIYVLEHTESAKRTLLSSIYDASSIGGILLASLFVTAFSAYGIIQEGWRILFWAGSVTALWGLLLRRSADSEVEAMPVAVRAKIRDNIRPLIAIVFTAGFSNITYSLAFDLMNGYIPLVTSLTKTEVMKINTWLLGLDMLLLPCFGLLAFYVGKEKVMKGASLFLVAGSIPLFALLGSSSLATVIAVRCVLVIAGVAFAAPYHAWAMERVPAASRYTILSLGYALGSQVIGKPTSALCLWLYQVTGEPFAPGVYLLVFGLLAVFSVRALKTSPSLQ